MTDLARIYEEPPTDERDSGRALPHDAQAEVAVLGAMLRDRGTLLEVSATIDAAHFYLPKHETIAAAMLRRLARLEPVDVHLLAVDLDRAGDLRRVGGEDYLRHLHEQGFAVPTDAALHYADLVRKSAACRKLVEAGSSIAALGYHPGDTDLDDLLARAQEAVDPQRIRAGIPGVEEDGQHHPWAPVDLAEVLDGGLEGPTATVCRRRDGKRLLYPAAIHSVSGEPGSGKSWFGLIAAAQEIGEHHDVVIVDFEDRAQTHVARLRALGVEDDQLVKHLRYIRPHAALDGAGWKHLADAARDATLVVIDGITEAMTLHGLSLMDNEDVARWIALLPSRLADLGPAVLQVDHVVKASETRGRYAIGGQHKLAAITGVAYKLVTVRSFGKGSHGHAKLVIDKDRHGDVGPNGSTAADVHLDGTQDDSAVFAWLDHPTVSIDEEGNFRPTILMGRVSQALTTTPGVTKNALRAAVKGKGARVDQAIDTLVREGYIRLEPAPRGGHFYYLIKPFESED